VGDDALGQSEDRQHADQAPGVVDDTDQPGRRLGRRATEDGVQVLVQPDEERFDGEQGLAGGDRGVAGESDRSRHPVRSPSAATTDDAAPDRRALFDSAWLIGSGNPCIVGGV
jgi:hypothetical protein